MKKAVLIFAMVSLLVLSAFGASAANYYPTQDAAENYSYTVTCALSTIADDAAAIVNGESMYGLVAVLGTGEDADITSATSYVYLDQATADAEGVVTFAGFLPMGVNPDDESFEECTLFIGGPGFDTAKELGVLKKAGAVAIEGVIVDAFSERGTTITVKDAAGTVVTSVEASNGAFTVPVAAAEGYTVEFDKAAYLKYSLTGVSALEGANLGNVALDAYAGDVNDNGEVNSTDLLALLADFGATTLKTATADLNDNGAVNSTDLLKLLASFGKADVTMAYVAE